MVSPCCFFLREGQSHATSPLFFRRELDHLVSQKIRNQLQEIYDRYVTTLPSAFFRSYYILQHRIPYMTIYSSPMILAETASN